MNTIAILFPIPARPHAGIVKPESAFDGLPVLAASAPACKSFWQWQRQALGEYVASGRTEMNSHDA